MNCQWVQAGRPDEQGEMSHWRGYRDGVWTYQMVESRARRPKQDYEAGQIG